MKQVRSEELADYRVDVDGDGDKMSDADDKTIRLALTILMRRIRTREWSMTSPQAVKDYLKLKIATLEREVFGCLFLDSQNRVIYDGVLFQGTLAQTSVYPREVVKAALMHNCAGVILYHNHPSGLAEPSRADEFLTTTLKSALALVDIRVLDHIIVGGAKTVSFAEKGML